MVEALTCPSCRSANEPGRKFCGECGTPLAQACPSCGTPNPPTVKFCGECGKALAAQAPTQRQEHPTTTPAAERRLVSVLFADLVGFTTVSEGRDAEDVRELLSRYFDTARSIIERYGGTVEKFIGDAVMAVWGTPTATEDDAERAVRAGLELVSAIPALDGALQARAGVLTGEAAVTIGAEGQGMVAGDLVNTASRVQSLADPGVVLVDEPTRRASEAAVAYEEAGTHELKGKTEAILLWRALRVVSSRRGEVRSVGLEAPFVGRDRELKLVKDLFHASADEGKAHLLTVVGIAGIGKSRLAWELEKYLEGLAGMVWWHRGRCLAYGDGVAYWALAEMIRMRARIAEDDPPGEARSKLAAILTEIVLDPGERAFVEPRLQHLLALTERTAPDKQDLFSGWRLFFERMAETDPVVMVFEDLQWADAALLEFIAYLLEWSRSHPIFVVALARPEVSERSPGWNAHLRNQTTLTLEPLAGEAMEALLGGLVPGLPEDVARRIVERADGVPLYAVETVRMLLDRGLVEPDGSRYRMSGEIEALEVPETLQALIASRLDGLDARERQLLQDASVLGKSFAAQGVATLSGIPRDDVERVLTSLVRKEVLWIDTDPRSPERGQYGFLQALVQRVAYETLSRRDRKAKHLAAARYIAEDAGVDADEMAELVATHLLDAHRSAPDDPDANQIKVDAREWLRRAGERAASVAAVDDAQRAFESAAELADEPIERARLLERAAELAFAAARLDRSVELLRTAHALCEEAGATHDVARVAAELGVALWQRGDIEEALRLMEDAFAVLAEDEPDVDVAMLAAQLGRLNYFAGDLEHARERIELALDLAEALELPVVLASALNTKSLLLDHRPHESRALLSEALRIALAHDLVSEALRAYNNLLIRIEGASYEEATRLRSEALELARRHGDRFWEARMAGGVVTYLRDSGEWDEALALAGTVQESNDAGSFLDREVVARIHIDRGDPQAARAILDGIPELDPGVDVGLIVAMGWKRQLTSELEGRAEDSLAAALDLLSVAIAQGASFGTAALLWTAAKLATELGEPRSAKPALEIVDGAARLPRGPMVASQVHRLRAVVAAAEGDEPTAEAEFAAALSTARSFGKPAWLVHVLADYGRWLVETGRADEGAPLLEEARELCERMGARAWLAEIDAVLTADLTAS